MWKNLTSYAVIKCATFLLTVCLFKTVFADFMQQLVELRTDTLIGLEDIVEKHRNDVDGLIKYFKERGATNYIYQCKNDYDELVAYHTLYKKLCEGCYERGIQEREIEKARKCYGDNLDALQKRDKKLRARAKKCFSKFLGLLGPREYRPFFEIPL